MATQGSGGPARLLLAAPLIAGALLAGPGPASASLLSGIDLTGLGSRHCSPVKKLACAPHFQSRTSRIDPKTRRRMTGISWHRGCPVPLRHLRLLRVSFWGFDGRVHRGRLIVNRDAVHAIVDVMHALYHHRYPFRRMRLVDAYGAVDDVSMAHDNTSAFNCRFIAGRPGVWSQHAYGRAIDVNPIENPYVTSSGFVSPPQGRRYSRRSRRLPGMIHARGAVVAAFASAGWGWGGSWNWPKDYQHFSANGH